MDDILSTLQEAKLRYEKKSQKSRAWTWLNRLSKGMMHYGAIIDTVREGSLLLLIHGCLLLLI